MKRRLCTKWAHMHVSKIECPRSGQAATPSMSWHRIHRISALASAGANRSAHLAKCAVHHSLTSLHGSSKSRCE